MKLFNIMTENNQFNNSNMKEAIVNSQPAFNIPNYKFISTCSSEILNSSSQQTNDAFNTSSAYQYSYGQQNLLYYHQTVPVIQGSNSSYISNIRLPLIAQGNTYQQNAVSCFPPPPIPPLPPPPPPPPPPDPYSGLTLTIFDQNKDENNKLMHNFNNPSSDQYLHSDINSYHLSDFLNTVCYNPSILKHNTNSPDYISKSNVAKNLKRKLDNSIISTEFDNYYTNMKDYVYKDRKSDYENNYFSFNDNIKQTIFRDGSDVIFSNNGNKNDLAKNFCINYINPEDVVHHEVQYSNMLQKEISNVASLPKKSARNFHSKSDSPCVRIEYNSAQKYFHKETFYVPKSNAQVKWNENYSTKFYSKCMKKSKDDRIFSSSKNSNNWEKRILKWINETEDAEIMKTWIRSSPADLYYYRNNENPKIMMGTPKLKILCEKFNDMLLKRHTSDKDKILIDPINNKKNGLDIECDAVGSIQSNFSSTSDDDDDHMHLIMKNIKKKKEIGNHKNRLHPELWYNDHGQMNDGPVCRCSLKARKSGIRHGFYAGEQHLFPCEPYTNSADRLYHYRVTISPPTNFLVRTPTIINHDGHEFIFEGFSLLSHFPLKRFPTCSVIRFNIHYTILYLEEKMPENFTIMELNLFTQYLFYELLELADLELKAINDPSGCDRFHILPRFVRELEDNGKEILSMHQVLFHLLESNELLVKKDDLQNIAWMSQNDWCCFADKVRGMLVTYPGKKPNCIRVDQLDREDLVKNPYNSNLPYPELIHFGIRPPQLSYAGNPDYQKKWRDYVRLRHLLANKPKPTYEDKRKLEFKEMELQKLRLKSSLKRDITVVLSSEGFYRTGIMCDLVQHAMLLPVLICHLRFHLSLSCLEETINYHFKNRALLQLALTHPSYRENYGTNPDHARNSLTNCGIRHPEYGDRRIHYQNTRKRGINTLIQIMSRFGKHKETPSNINHNERLEFLGDAVVEFLTTIHLFFMFPAIEEGGLATYRAAIVQNQHLALLAQKLNLDKYLLYAHGSDLCHELELKHAMANCFEALMGALLLDAGLRKTDEIFSYSLFTSETELLDIWTNIPKHPLQEQESESDRHWIEKVPFLKKLTQFEQEIGIEFQHIRLLARAFTDRSVGYNDLTMGSNQRLEFLGDTVLQLISSEHLYKYFPEHHEGHLSLLRSSLVNNCTQSVVCDDLGMTKYAMYRAPKLELKVKDKADLLEAFLGALFIDKGLHYCWKFCEVCFFPRLQHFILNQEWNDPKSKLQQCCLTLRSADGGEPDIPIYKVLECKGPTNMRIYTVAVYFRHKRLAKACGASIQTAEMNAAKAALETSKELFPQLVYQQKVVQKIIKKNVVEKVSSPKNDLKQENDQDDLPLSYRNSNPDGEIKENIKKLKKKRKKKKKKECCKIENMSNNKIV